MQLLAPTERIKALPARVREILMGLLGRQDENEEFPVERLKQIADRLDSRLEQSQVGDSAEKTAPETGELKAGIEAASQQSSQLGVVRWCGNSDRYLTQEVRDPAGLGGAYNLFEIDPMSKMPD
ncbi:MAG: hypothetical protein AB7W16_28670 [Candidatus Obscuribacterales bacterium]